LSIVTTIKGGSETAFTEVFYQYHSKLYSYFLKKTRSEDIANELAQISFIKLWNFKHTLSEDHSFDSQLFNIARTCLIDFIRRQSVLNKNITSLQQQYNTSHLTTQPDSSFETSHYFNLAIQALPPVRKKVFALSRIQGFSYREIAHQLSISVKTVEDHMAKAIKQIRALTSFF
jgi:RNA polymerase sigma-70 factor (ECF subfamily)